VAAYRSQSDAHQVPAHRVAHLRSDAMAGLNTLADWLASYADWHGPAVARPHRVAAVRTMVAAATLAGVSGRPGVELGLGRGIAGERRRHLGGPRPG
jgi:hypothetical protein